MKDGTGGTTRARMPGPEVLLRRAAHVPEKARFPVIDAHNHLFADMPPGEMTTVMDAVGVRIFVNVTGNCAFPF
ncbi:MAG: hypothetical protein ACLQDL_00770, partial [Spirochaetia bacterium]